MKLEGEDGDDGEERKEVPEDGDDLGVPEPRIMGMRMTSPIESGAGSSGSMTGLGIDSAGAGLGEVVLMRGEFMVLDR